MNLNPFKTPDFAAMDDKRLKTSAQRWHKANRVGFFLLNLSFMGGLGVMIKGAALLGATASVLGPIGVFCGLLATTVFVRKNRNAALAELEINRGVIVTNTSLKGSSHNFMPLEFSLSHKEMDERWEREAAARQAAQELAARKAQEAFDAAVKKDTVLTSPVLAPRPLDFSKKPPQTGGQP